MDVYSFRFANAVSGHVRRPQGVPEIVAAMIRDPDRGGQIRTRRARLMPRAGSCYWLTSGIHETSPPPCPGGRGRRRHGVRGQGRAVHFHNVEHDDSDASSRDHDPLDYNDPHNRGRPDDPSYRCGNGGRSTGSHHSSSDGHHSSANDNHGCQLSRGSPRSLLLARGRNGPDEHRHPDALHTQGR